MSQPESLSERELEILSELVTGASNRQIAQVLDISPNTVKVHLRNVYEKLGVSSRTEATLVALRDGLVSVEGIETGDETPASATMVDGYITDNPSEPTPTAPPTADDRPPAIVPAAEDAGSATVGATYPAPSRTWPAWLGILLGTTLLVLVGLITVLVLRPSQAQAPASSPVAEIPSLERWRALAQLPAPRTGASAVTAQRDLLLVGGQRSQSPQADVWRYDESVGRWETIAPLPQPATDSAVTVASGRLFVVGGISSEGAPIPAVQRFDLSMDQWREGPPLPTPLARAALAAFEGDLFLFGGWNGEEAQSTIYRLGADEEAWEAVGELPSPRMSLAAAPVDEGIVLLGGQDATGTALREVTFFDPRSGDLRNEAPLPIPAAQPRATTLGTALYVLESGALFERGPQSTWKPLETPADGELPDEAALVALDPYLIVAGGTDGDEATGTVWQYQAIYRSFLPLGTSP